MNNELQQQRKKEQLAKKLKENLQRRKKMTQENIKKIATKQAKLDKKN